MGVSEIQNVFALRPAQRGIYGSDTARTQFVVVVSISMGRSIVEYRDWSHRPGYLEDNTWLPPPRRCRVTGSIEARWCSVRLHRLGCGWRVWTGTREDLWEMIDLLSSISFWVIVHYKQKVDQPLFSGALFLPMPGIHCQAGTLHWRLKSRSPARAARCLEPHLSPSYLNFVSVEDRQEYHIV